MPTCSNCGHNNPADSNYCSRCGFPLRTDGERGESSTEGEERIPTGDTTRTLAAVAAEEREGESLTAEDEAAVHALPVGSSLLMVRRGSGRGSRFLLNTDLVTAGRHAEADIFLDDISVSRKHAVFTRTPEGFMIKDQGSLNGTYVNRKLVDEALLHSGDEVQIGKFRLVYFASPSDSE